MHCCINLPEDDEAARAREMTTEQVEDVLRQAADVGCLRVRFTGGEPLLRDDFERLYVYARRLGMRVLLFTNARRVTPGLVELLQRIPPLVKAEVTVYGMHRDSYEAVSRVPGSFDEAWRGIGLLLDGGIPFVAKAALLPPNRAEMDEFAAWCVDAVGMEQPPRYAMFLDVRGRRDDETADRRIEALRASPEDGLAVLTARPDQYRRQMQEFGGKFMGPQGDVLFACGAGHGVSVDAYGRAQPCMGVRAPELTVPLFEDRLRGWGRAGRRTRYARRRPRALRPAQRPARAGPGVPPPLRALLPQGPLRAVPGQVVVGARHAGYPGGVSLLGRPRPGPLARLAGRGRARLGGRGLAGAGGGCRDVVTAARRVPLQPPARLR